MLSSVCQLRLSTGSRINRAEDDSAGYAIPKKLEAQVRGQAQALSNIEQMEIVKLQILQQTGTAALAQSNTAPRSILSLFG